MKRSSSIPNEVLFLRLPIELINKIQSILMIVSLIRLGRTCKTLYEIQKSYLEFKAIDIHAICIQRIREYLEKRDLFDFVEKFLLKFDSIISGSFVLGYLFENIASYPMTICVSKLILFEDVYNYIKQNINDQSSLICVDYDFSIIGIIDKVKPKKIQITIVFSEDEKIIQSFEDKLPHLARKTATNLKKLYCLHLWELLKHKEHYDEEMRRLTQDI